LLFSRGKSFEWARQVTTGTEDRGARRPVVPVARRHERYVRSETNKELLDQQSVINDRRVASGHAVY
jgi:hypothetical protein